MRFKSSLPSWGHLIVHIRLCTSGCAHQTVLLLTMATHGHFASCADQKAEAQSSVQLPS